jgi:hypothetical protein
MDASCKIQGSIHVFHLIHKCVSRILGTYQTLTERKGGSSIQSEVNHFVGGCSFYAYNIAHLTFADNKKF